MKVKGTPKNDQLFGRDGVSSVYGLGGNDALLSAPTVETKKGWDDLFGGAGDDYLATDLSLKHTQNKVILDGGSGKDLLSINVFSDVDHGKPIELAAELAKSFQIKNMEYFEFDVDYTGKITTTANSDYVNINSGSCNVYSGSGNDVIKGATSAHAGSGNDQVYVGTGQSTAKAWGEDGNDLLYDGQNTSNSVLDGGSGNDTLFALKNAGTMSIMTGGAGKDAFGTWGYAVQDGTVTATVTDFNLKDDKVQYQVAPEDIDVIHWKQDGEDTIVWQGTGVEANVIRLENTDASEFTQDNILCADEHVVQTREQWWPYYMHM
jgi:Ca2+-binding RTX toxin-like protein